MELIYTEVSTKGDTLCAELLPRRLVDHPTHGVFTRRRYAFRTRLKSPWTIVHAVTGTLSRSEYQRPVFT